MPYTFLAAQGLEASVALMLSVVAAGKKWGCVCAQNKGRKSKRQFAETSKSFFRSETEVISFQVNDK